MGGRRLRAPEGLWLLVVKKVVVVVDEVAQGWQGGLVNMRVPLVNSLPIEQKEAKKGYKKGNFAFSDVI